MREGQRLDATAPERRVEVVLQQRNDGGWKEAMRLEAWSEALAYAFSGWSHAGYPNASSSTAGNTVLTVIRARAILNALSPSSPELGSVLLPRAGTMAWGAVFRVSWRMVPLQL